MSEPRIIKGGVAVDDRGRVTFCNDFNMTEVKRFYMLENHEHGFVRAWHGHVREAKWITVLSGVAIVAVVPLVDVGYVGCGELWELGKPSRYIMHADGSVLFVPPRYANGAKNLTDSTRIMHFSNMTMDEAKGDDYRFSPSFHDWVWKVEER